MYTSSLQWQSRIMPRKDNLRTDTTSTIFHSWCCRYLHLHNWVLGKANDLLGSFTKVHKKFTESNIIFVVTKILMCLLCRELEIIPKDSEDPDDHPAANYSLFETYFRYIFAFRNIVDLITILPYYIFFGLRSRGSSAIVFLRVFRLLKIVRIIKGWSG